MILKEELKRVIRSHQDQLQKDLGVPRDTTPRPQPKFATIITGVRRCGKSTLARQALKDTEPVYYISFEDINLAEFELKDFTRLDQAFKETLGEDGTYLLDEIQNVDSWEKYVRQLVDRGEKTIITGSNATMLSKELGTRLTGRHLSRELYPFSYHEFLKLKGSEPGPARFTEYLQKGGFPEYLKTDNDDIIKNLFHDVFYRDVLQRNELRNEKAIKTLIHYLLSNIGKETSYNKLRHLIDVGSVNTVSQFIDHLEQAYLLFAIRKYDPSLKKQLVNPKKIYCVDTAIIRQNAFTFSENKGRMLENAAFIELKRRGEEVYYHKAAHECDFLTKQGTSITQAIQACWELTPENERRELEGLKEAMDTHGLDEGLILTHDQEDELEDEGRRIRVRPMWKWMLDEPDGDKTRTGTDT
ncbi:MAG: ATP-binding protein [Candidatus Woesearchaeota archaeon]